MDNPLEQAGEDSFTDEMAIRSKPLRLRRQWRTRSLISCCGNVVQYSGDLGLTWYGFGTGSHLTGAGSALRSSLISGFTEKNLCRHGSHRNAGIRSTRKNIATIPGTCSAAIRCNSKLPQFLQCA